MARGCQNRGHPSPARCDGDKRHFFPTFRIRACSRVAPVGRGIWVVRMISAAHIPRLRSVSDTDCAFPSDGRGKQTLGNPTYAGLRL